MYIPFIIFGIGMVSIGVYIVITKNVFGKNERGKWIVEALRLSEKALKGISVAFGILITLIGLNFLINGVISADPFSAFWFIPQ